MCRKGADREVKYGTEKYGMGAYGNDKYVYNRNLNDFVTGNKRLYLNYDDLNRIENNLVETIQYSNYLGYTDLSFTKNNWGINDMPDAAYFDCLSAVITELYNKFPLTDTTPEPINPLRNIGFEDINTIEQIEHDIAILYKEYEKNAMYACDDIYCGGT